LTVFVSFGKGISVIYFALHNLYEECVMQNPKTIDILRSHFASAEVKDIVAFLEQDGGFYLLGEDAIVSIFLSARACGKSAQEVLAACRVAWEKIWQYMSPDVRGDAKAPGDDSEKNRAAFNRVYMELGKPFAESVTSTQGLKQGEGYV
jgi:hypothetical protein